jgi:hypothetical protein
MRRAICLLLSACVASLEVPHAVAQGTSSGSGGSITIDTVDPDTGQHVDAGLIRQGQNVRVVVKAFDSLGRAVECGNPSIGVINGVAGTQLIGPQAGGPPDIIQGGANFGSAEITATCPKLPGVQAKSFAASTGRPLGAARPQPAPQPAPAAAAASTGSATGTMLLAGAAIAGGVALAAAAASSAGGGSSSSGSSTQACSQRVCIASGFSCSCSNDSTNTTCSTQLPVSGSGQQCIAINTNNRNAWCAPGLSCINGSCGTRSGC